jgi:cyclopropane fatty-acyl-phospholipid synthase-like methyltransferase
MIDNDFNLQAYEKNAITYLEARKNKDIGGGGAERINFLKEFLPVGSLVFEIGSGGGEDALELAKNGYQVMASDFVPKFVEICKSSGLDAILFDAKTDTLPENVDAVYANAVFVHFTPEETSDFLTRAKSHLVGEKLIFLSVLKGEGSERSGRSRGFERDFQYYSEEQIAQILESSGYKCLKTKVIDDKWIQLIAQVI